MPNNLYAPPTPQELAAASLYSAPSQEEILRARELVRPHEQFDAQAPYYNIPKVLKEEWDSGHAPNAEENFGTTGAMPTMMMTGGAKAAGLMRSATLPTLEAAKDLVSSSAVRNGLMQGGAAVARGIKDMPWWLKALGGNELLHGAKGLLFPSNNSH